MDSRHADQNYSLLVSVCDLDERQAKIVVVHMNNKSAQGEWNTFDLEKLLLSDMTMIPEMSFSQVDMEMMFPSNTQLSQIFSKTNKELEKILSQTADTKAMSTEQRKKMMEGLKEKSSTENYIVVVFATVTEKIQWLAEHKLPQNERYIDAGIFKNAIT